ncbi:MAG: Rpn family recombination-promoting nuclease/putative transposase [Pseudomonadota bacterium]
MTEITRHHDLFFKEVFSRPEVAENFVMNFLPPNVTEHLKRNTFRLRKGSFVDARLKEYFTDMLYKVDLKEGRRAYIYVVFEHKSRPDLKVAYQLLRYMTRVLDRTTKGGVRPVRPVIPVVLYHGTARWKVPLDFAALYKAPKAVRPGLLDFTYHLCDLSGYTDEDIKARALLSATLGLGLLLMKNFFRPDLSKRLRGYFELVGNMSRQSALEFLESAFRYLGAARERVKPEEVGRALEEALGEKGEIYMESLLDKWMNEGIEKGLQQGVQQGLQQGLQQGEQQGRQAGTASLTIRQLTRRFGELDESTQERIRQLSLEEVEALGEELLDFKDKSALHRWLERSAH